MTDNLSMEILKIIKRNPRITPALIHNKVKRGIAYSNVEFALKTLRQTGEVETIARGLYVLTNKGVETLRSSEKTQEVEG